MFAKLRKAIIGFIMSVGLSVGVFARSSVWPHKETELPLEGYYAIWYLSRFQNLSRKFKMH